MPRRAAASARADRASTADSIGSSENDTNSDTSTEQAIVSANGLNHCPAIAAHEGDRHEHRDDRERRRRDGEADLVGALARRRVVVLPHLHVAHDVLAHHDRVVDQDADREREPEQRHRVQREAERPARR